MPEICKEAQWLATLLLMNDPVFAREIIDLVGQKNQIEALMKAGAWDKKAGTERLHTINEKIDLFIEAKLLAGEGTLYNLGDEAKSRLIAHLKKAGYEIDRAKGVMDAMTNTKQENGDVLALILADGNQQEADAMIKKFNESLARYIIAQDKMRLVQGIKHDISNAIADLKKSFVNSVAKMGDDMTKRLQTTLADEAGDVGGVADNSYRNISQPKLFKREAPDVEEFENISQKEARDTVYKYFDSSEVSVTFADNLTTPEGQAAFGAYCDRMITFVANPKKYVPEHEVTHAYIDLFLNEEEKGALYYDALDGHLDEIREYMKINGQSSLREATEDWIADGFVKYIQRKQTFTGRLKDLFDELWFRIKQIFGNKDQVRQLYKDIESKKRPSNRGIKRYKYEEYKGVVDDHGFPVDTKMAEYMKNSYATVGEELGAPLVIVYHTSDSPLVYDSLKEGTKGEGIYGTSNPKMSASYSSGRRRKFIEPGNKVTKEQQVKNFTNGLNEYWENIGWYNRMKEDLGLPRYSVKSDVYHRLTSGGLSRHYTLEGPGVWSSTLSDLGTYLGAKEMGYEPMEISQRLSKFFDRYKEGDFSTISLVEQDLRYSKITRADLKKIIKQANTPEEAQELLAQKLLELAKKKVKLKEYRDINEMIKDYGNNFDVGYVNEYRGYINMENPLIVRDNVKKPWNDLTIDGHPEAGEHLRTREVAVWAREHGYDGVIIKKIMDTGGGEFGRQYGDVYIWFNENQFKHIENRNPSTDKRMFYKRAAVSEDRITPATVRKDRVLQEEYNNRINTIRTLQTMINDDLNTLKNADIGLFSVKDGLFGDAKIKDMPDEIKSMASMYAIEGDDLNTMTLSQLRQRIEDTRVRFKDAHKQKNVLAQMRMDREADDKAMLGIYENPEVKVKDVSKEVDKATATRRTMNSIIRSDYKQRQEPELKKGMQDPMNRKELPPEAEKVLKENIEKDLEQVKNGEAPSNLVTADDIWKEFYEMSDKAKQRELFLNNYLIGKIYLGEGDDALESALKWLSGKNLDGYATLTLDQINNITDLGQLEQIVYSHIGDIIYDKSLRQALKDKQYELWTTVSQADAKTQAQVLSKTRSLQKTSSFLEAGGLYSDVTLYDRVGTALRDIFDIDPSINNRDLYDQFTSAVTNYSSKRQSNTVKVGGVDMTAADLVRGIYAISRDDMVKATTKEKADPMDQLKVSAKKLFNIGSEKDAKQAQKRIDDLFNSITPEDLEGADVTKMAYTTTSAVKIEGEITDENVVFYNYRDGLYAQDPQTTYGEFFDELSKQNSLVVDGEHNIKEAFTIAEIPVEAKYIVVNDLNRWDDKELRDFIYSIPEDSRPQVIYPRGGMMGNYYVENGKLKFKTTSNQLYNELTRNASAKTLGAFANTMEEVTEESMKDLEEKALEYFRTMMGLTLDGAPKNKAEYKSWVINNLRIVTGLPISAEMDVYNPQSTWKMASDIIRYQLGATGRYTKVIKDVDQIVTDISSKFANDRAGFFEDVKALVGGSDEYLNLNADAIKEAYINYNIAQTIEAKIQAKGTLMALANGGEYSKITIDTFNSALREDDIIGTLGPIIYGNREYTQAEQQALARLGDDILATYTFNFGSNLIEQGYSMPLISPAMTIRKLLKGEPIMNDGFTQAFIKKNGLSENSSPIESLFSDALPSDLGIQLPSSMFDGTIVEMPNVVVDEVPNVVIPTNYNQLSSIIIKSKTSQGGGATWEEEAIISNILDNYYNIVERNVRAGTMTPTLAQQLKLQAGWALDMAEQDLILSKYDSFLTLEQRNGLMGGKYKLRIATTVDELDSVKRGNQDVLNGYRQRLGEMGQDWIKTYNDIDKAKKDLIDKGKIMTKVDGKVVTMNVHDMLIEQLNTLPDGLRGLFDNFKGLTKNEIRGIPYRQAYSIIKAIDIAKNAAARGNLYTRLMYKQNPTLANIDFFRRFKLNSDGIPEALTNNAAKMVDSSISDGLDATIKQNIMLDISQVMKKKGKLSEEELDKIVENQLSSYNKDRVIKNHYTNMFKAYTYLTDIPKDIKNTINGMLDVQLKETRKELSELDKDFYEGILNSRIVLSDGSEMTLRDVLAGDIDAYKSNLFIEKGSDGVYRNVNMKETTSTEMGLSESQKIDYSDAMYSMINSLDQVTDSERKMNTVILNNARKILSKFTTTKRILDADYLIGGANDLLRNLIKSNAFSGWGKLWGDHDLISKGWDKITGKSLFNQEDWNTIRNYYYTYYGQSMDVLEKMVVSNDLQATALEMAKYFKRIEETLGSADGAMGASVNTELNRAFGRLGTIVLNVNTSTQVHSLMNLIGNNQILGFFKFAKEGDGAYFDLFSSLKTSKQRFTGIQYIRDLEDKDLKRFNEVFNSNYSMREFKIIMQALGGYQLGTPARSRLNTIMRGINSSSVLARALMSYPFQLFTIAPQSIAYNLKANAYKRALGVEDMAKVNASREGRDILTSDYIELNPKSWISDRISRGYKNVLHRYSGEEVQNLMKNQKVEMDDGIMDLFGKSYDHASKNYSWEQFVALFDATRDNANNIIDALMAQKFKNLAFVKALQNNNVVTFQNVDQFERFMDDISIPQELKDKLMDSLRIYSGRIFKDMLGTGFSGLDKLYASSAIGEILVGLMNAINFRGAWGLNMWRQTFEKIFSVAKTLRFVGDKRAMQQAVDYIARTPEFSNLSQAMFNDLVWMWKLAKFSDNGKQPDDESEADIMDFCEWALNNIELVSQQWQGLMSFGPTRLIQAPAEAAIKHWQHPEYYGPDAWIGAFIQTFASNFGRNRKPWNFVVSALVAAQADGDMSRAWNYIADNFYTLSAGTLRYMLEEGYNAYGANTPLVYEIGGIPSFIAGEQWEGSDTAFLYNMRQEETAHYLTHLGEDEYSIGGLLSQMANYSQLFSFFKQSIKGLGYAMGKENWKSSKSTYDLSDLDEAYADSPEWQEWRRYGFIMPKHEPGYETYYDSIVSYFTESEAPGGANFFKGVSNFMVYGHVNGKDEGSYYDKVLEEFYTRVEEKDPGALKRLISDEALMAQVASDTKASIQTSLSFMNKELALFDGDPEYNKYAALIYKGIMSNVMYDELQAFADRKTDEWKAKGLLPNKKDKVSASEIKKMPALYSEFKQEFVDRHWDDLRVADSESMENAMFNFLAKTSKDATDKFFDKKTFTNSDGEEVERYYFKSNIKSQVKQLIDFEAAMQDGEWERAVIEGTALTKTFSYDHTVSPEVALHIFNRIKNSDTLTEKEKLEAMTEFVSNNLDAFTYDSEFATENPELWEEAKTHYNEIVYQVNYDLIQKANDYALSLESDNEKSGKGGGLAGKVVNLSNKLAKIQEKTAGGTSSGEGKYTMTWVKAPILDPADIINDYSKVPTVNFNPKFTSKGYTPKTDLGGQKKQQPTAKPVKVKKVKVKEKDIEVM